MTTIKNLANELGITRQGVWYWIKRLHITPAKVAFIAVLDDDQVATIKAAVKEPK